jgi:hypothetical protein
LCGSLRTARSGSSLKAMKRPGTTTLRRHYGLNAGNIEKQLKEMRKEFAWMRTEQREMACWINSLALRDRASPPRS